LGIKIIQRPKILSALGNRKSILFLLIIVSSSIGVVYAHGNIDQSSPGPSTLGLVNIVAAEINGQSFKTTANNIIAVEVEIFKTAILAAEPITIRIRDGEGLGGTLLGQTQTHTGLPALQGLVHFDFPVLIPLTPGNSYTFTVELNDPNDLFFVSLTQNANAPYVDGTAFINSQPESSDLIFNTFFDPSEGTVGGTPVPIDTTSLLLAGTQMTASWMIPVIIAAIGIGIVIARKF